MFLSSVNGRIKFFKIKTNKVRVLFSLGNIKPVNYSCSVFPLINPSAPERA